VRPGECPARMPAALRTSANISIENRSSRRRPAGRAAHEIEVRPDYAGAEAVAAIGMAPRSDTPALV